MYILHWITKNKKKVYIVLYIYKYKLARHYHDLQQQLSTSILLYYVEHVIRKIKYGGKTPDLTDNSYGLMSNDNNDMQTLLVDI